MKKLSIFLASLLLTFNAQAALQTSASEFNVNVPLFRGMWELGATGIFIRASTPEQDYALLYPTVTSFTGGSYKNVMPSVDFAYQLYAGYILPCSGNDIRLTYTEFYGKKSSHVRADNSGFVLPNELDLPATLALPNVTALFTGAPVILLDAIEAPLTGASQEADGFTSFRLNSWDLDFGQFIDIDTMVRIRYYFGVRMAKFGNKFNQHFLFANTDITQTQTIDIVTGATITTTRTVTGNNEQVVWQSTKFNGAGPRLGMEGSFHLGGGFGLIANLSAALLVGVSQSSLSQEISPLVLNTQYDISTAPPGFEDQITNITPAEGTLIHVFEGLAQDFDYGRNDRISPNLEGKAGINYTYPFTNCRNLTIEVGYFITHYFNALNRLSTALITEPAAGFSHTLDISFSGVYVSVQGNL